LFRHSFPPDFAAAPHSYRRVFFCKFYEPVALNSGASAASATFRHIVLRFEQVFVSRHPEIAYHDHERATA
jgi:hypothetical protein